MLVEHQHVEADFFGIDLLVDEPIEEIRRKIGFVDVVRQIEIGECHTHDARVLVRAFGEIADLHRSPLMTLASASGCSRSTQ